MYAYVAALTFSFLIGLLIVLSIIVQIYYINFGNNHIESLEKDCKDLNCSMKLER